MAAREYAAARQAVDTGNPVRVVRERAVDLPLAAAREPGALDSPRPARIHPTTMTPARFAQLAVTVTLVSCGAATAPPSAPTEMLGKGVELSLPTDKGALATVPAGGAPVTVLDFFGPTCPPCEKKVPALYARRAELEAAGAKLVLVAVLGDGETTDQARAALTRWGVTGASFLVDAGDASKTEAGVRGLPTTLVLDAKGTVRWSAPPDATASDVIAAARAVGAP